MSDIQIIRCLEGESSVPQPIRIRGEKALLEATDEHLAMVEEMIDWWFPEANYFVAGVEPV